MSSRFTYIFTVLALMTSCQSSTDEDDQPRLQVLLDDAALNQLPPGTTGTRAGDASTAAPDAPSNVVVPSAAAIGAWESCSRS